MKLTRVEAVELHRELWHRIAQREKEDADYAVKEEVLDEMMKERGLEDEDVINCCFCCEYAYQQNGDKEGLWCVHCPIDWEGKDTCELYYEWMYESDKRELIRIAKKNIRSARKKINVEIAP